MSSSSSSFTSMIPRYCGSTRSTIRRRSKNESRVDRSIIVKTQKELETIIEEVIPVRFLKTIFSYLTLSELKGARLVCKKWNSIILQVLINNSCFSFTGENTRHSEMTDEFVEFLRATPRVGFMWKLRCLVSKKNPSIDIPEPHVIPWHHLRIRNAAYYELVQWIHHSHLVNVTCLEFQNVIISHVKLCRLLAQFTNLKEFRDASPNYICPPGLRVLFEAESTEKIFDSQNMSPKAKSYEYFEREAILEMTPFKNQPLLHIEIRRSQLEDLILHLKLLKSLNCQQLLSIKMVALDTYISSEFVDQFHRPQDIKIDLYKQLRDILKCNCKTLVTLTLSFRHTSMDAWFDLLAKNFEDEKANCYKPELAQFFAYLNHFNWKLLNMENLKDLTLEFENKRDVAPEEFKYFADFIRSLPKLNSLIVSQFLLNTKNHQNVFSGLESLRQVTGENCICKFGILYRDKDINFLREIQDENFTNSLSAIMILSETPILTKFLSLYSILDTNNNPGGNKSQQKFKSITHFWYRDNIPEGHVCNLTRFRISDIVEDFPKLTTFIIKDTLHESTTCYPNVKRYNLIDDYGMQLILKHLVHLKYFSLYGNLTYLTDSGITGINSELVEKMNFTKNYYIDPQKLDRLSFSALKNLQYCSLEFVGSKVTDVSLWHGFSDLAKLKKLEISGILQISQEIVGTAQSKFPGTTLILKSVL